MGLAVGGDGVHRLLAEAFGPGEVGEVVVDAELADVPVRLSSDLRFVAFGLRQLADLTVALVVPDDDDVAGQVHRAAGVDVLALVVERPVEDGRVGLDAFFAEDFLR